MEGIGEEYIEAHSDIRCLHRKVRCKEQHCGRCQAFDVLYLLFAGKVTFGIFVGMLKQAKIDLISVWNTKVVFNKLY